jgi:glycosyltransferase involved in cell wall biosynthesis
MQSPQPPFHKTPTVLQVLPALHSGGVERGTIEVARAIGKTGWKSLVASEGGQLTAALSYVGAQHFKLPLKSKNPLRLWRNMLALEELIRTHRVDIIHARSRAPAWSAWYAAKRTGIKFVTTFHGIYGLEKEWKRRYNAIMTKGDRVIAVSSFVAQHIRDHYPMDANKLRVIHRGADLKIFNPAGIHPQRMADLARHWHLPELPVILFPGRITRWKGQDVFIRALAQLPHRHFIAILVGDDSAHDSYRGELEKLIREGNLEGHVRMVGTTLNMAEAYTLARFVVATSTDPEAFGRVVVEAQAMGRPVIATNHGGARETVIDGTTGWLVEPGSVGTLTRLLEQALNLDEDTHRWMGEQAVANAQHFTSEMMCAKTLDVYREVLGR